MQSVVDEVVCTLLISIFHACSYQRVRALEFARALIGLASLVRDAEVFRNQPYNEKSDVFSFGVLAYEVLAAELLSVSVFNTGRAAKMGISDPQGYAALVRGLLVRRAFITIFVIARV